MSAIWGGICCRKKVALFMKKSYSKLLIWFMEKIGFKTYHKWQKNEYTEYISKAGFHVMDSILVKGNPLLECILIGRKKSTFDVWQLSKSKKLGKERGRI